MTIEILSLLDINIPPNRHRTELDPVKIEELAESISNLGNIHPPVLENERDWLVAGERRYRAIMHLSSKSIGYECNGTYIEPGKIAILRMGSLTPTEVREVELEENIRRVDLTWQERERAIADLHQLRLGQSGGVQTYKDTATEILGREAIGGEPSRLVRNATIISQHLDDPEVAKAKNEHEAIKIIARKAERQLRESLASMQGSEATTTRHALYRCDAIEGMRALETGSIACIVTDPPYGIDAQKFGDQADLDHQYDDSYTTWQALMMEFAEQAYHICEDRAHAYVFCDPRRFLELAKLFDEANWNVWPTPLIWDKGNGMLPRPDHGPRRCYETILFANKGDRTVNAVYSDVIRIAGERDKLHAAQKPVELFVNLLQRSTIPGDRVLDPFAGSGPIFPAADKCSCRATGFELDAGSYAIGLRHLSGEVE